MADPKMTDPQKGAETDYKIERPKPKMTRQQKLGMGVLLAGASLAALWTIWPSSSAIPDVETSAVEEFQDQAGGSPFGAIEPGPEAKPTGDGFSDIEGELASQREDLEARNATLQSEVERLQRELGDLADTAATGHQGLDGRRGVQAQRGHGSDAGDHHAAAGGLRGAHARTSVS